MEMLDFPGSVAAVEETLVGELAGAVQPDRAVPAARALLSEVIRVYRQALDGDLGIAAARRGRISAAGREFVAAGGTSDSVTNLLSRLASRLIDRAAAESPERVATLVDVAHRVIRDVLDGGPPPVAGLRTRHDVVRRLILDGYVPAELEGVLEDEYLVVVTHFARTVRGELLDRFLAENEQHGMLGTLVGTDVVILVPTQTGKDAAGLLEDLGWRFGGRQWLSAVKANRLRITAGYKAARGVIALAYAAKRPPGVYRLEDVLIEHAIAHDPVAFDYLVRAIRPLESHPVLSETLDALIGANFNRTAAARDLYIHRSTMTYRIQRIAEVTGYDPMTTKDALVLSIATTAVEMSGIRGLGGSSELQIITDSSGTTE